jgi:transcriptional regulator with XRE-family HTH domain
VNLIKKIREKNQITQGELAIKLGVTQSALSQIEMKDKAPSMKNFLMLVKLGYITEETIYGIVKELISKQWRN